MTHTSQRRGLDPSRPGEELIVLAITPSADRGREGIREAVNELAAKMLEHGHDHWPEWTNDRLAAIPEGSYPGTLAVAYTDVKRVEDLLNDLKKEWLPRNRERAYPISIVLTGLTDDAHAICVSAYHPTLLSASRQTLSPLDNHRQAAFPIPLCRK